MADRLRNLIELGNETFTVADTASIHVSRALLKVYFCHLTVKLSANRNVFLARKTKVSQPSMIEFHARERLWAFKRETT